MVNNPFAMARSFFPDPLGPREEKEDLPFQPKAFKPVPYTPDPMLSEDLNYILGTTIPDFPGVEVTSGYRDPEHNERVGGAKGSAHMHGGAVDLNIGALDEDQKIALIERLQKQGAKGFINYSNSPNTLHVDTGLPIRPDVHFMYDRSSKYMGNAPDWYRQASQYSGPTGSLPDNRFAAIGDTGAVGSASGGGKRMGIENYDRFANLWNYFTQNKGVPPEQAAVLLGNIYAESRGVSTALNEDDGGPGRDSFGLLQWQGDRRTALEQFANEQRALRKNPNLRNDDPYLQADFLLKEGESTEKRNFERAFAQPTLEGQATAFAKHVVRPAAEHIPARAKYARMMYDAFGPGGGFESERLRFDGDTGPRQMVGGDRSINPSFSDTLIGGTDFEAARGMFYQYQEALEEQEEEVRRAQERTTLTTQLGLARGGAYEGAGDVAAYLERLPQTRTRPEEESAAPEVMSEDPTAPMTGPRQLQDEAPNLPSDVSPREGNAAPQMVEPEGEAPQPPTLTQMLGQIKLDGKAIADMEADEVDLAVDQQFPAGEGSR